MRFICEGGVVFAYNRPRDPSRIELGNSMDKSKLNLLIESPPKLHFWGGEWRVGGLGPNQIRLVERAVQGLGDSIRVIETGAGLSTLVFLALGARVLSLFTKNDLHERIDKAIQEFELPSAEWQYVLGRSEFTFPKYLCDHPETASDLVLIDGGHLIHTVFTDFTYAFASLKQGGILLLDDLRLSSVGLLYQMLKASNFVEEVDVAGKTAAFRKTVKVQFPVSWGDVHLGGAPLADLRASGVGVSP